MLRGGKLPATRAYYLIVFGDAFLLTFADNVLILFQTIDAALSPLQLVVVAGVYRLVILVAEVPTGLVADTVSRRRSVLMGLTLLGVGLIIGGAQPVFITILIGQAIVGVGYTFMSGAHQAWIADEVGIEQANRIYIRVAQLSMWFWITAVPASVLLATLGTNLPILLGGALLLCLAGLLTLLMPETGFQRPQQEVRYAAQTVLSSVVSTYSNSLRLLRMRPLLLTMFLITAFYGVAGLGFQRLWLLHFNENIGYPDRWGFGPVEWFGAIRVAAAVLSLLALQVVSRKFLPVLASHTGVIKGLFLINALQLNAILLMAVAGSFELAAFAYCATFALSYALDPFQLAWINQNVTSDVRATVISMNSQADSLGRTLSAPAFGAIANALSLRAALMVSSLVLIVPLGLYFRAYGQGPSTSTAGEPATEPRAD